MNRPIADLHCDLLCYLIGGEGSPRTAFDAQVRCSIPQLKAGNVQTQVMAIFTETGPDSTRSGWAQAEMFQQLPKQYPDAFPHLIKPLLAIENASSFCDETEPLECGLKRLTILDQDVSKIIYLSMTWNTENRFGGGAHTSIGLKEDGRRLLDFMNKKRIAIDLSHTSDALAYGILNTIDQYSLEIPVIASHSNCRSIVSVARNLPDELIREIFRRNGVIGLNFIRDFVGKEDPLNFARHLEHFLKLGGEHHLCFGADFHYGNDVSPEFRKAPENLFFPDYDHSGTYERLFALWRKELQLDAMTASRIAHENLSHFLE